MLVLSRSRNETIMIGDEVEITIVEIKGDTVRVGISAPRSIPVHRKEVYLAIQQENIEAARSDAEGLDLLGQLLGGNSPGKKPESDSSS
ncbi:MAG: carbon storage regulator CsrA [Planctomycetota bacterium]|jgi:carbon storage regulator|nr:carbon storage regulator CsrA [Planctomycetota bacterium]